MWGERDSLRELSRGDDHGGESQEAKIELRLLSSYPSLLRMSTAPSLPVELTKVIMKLTLADLIRVERYGKEVGSLIPVAGPFLASACRVSPHVERHRPTLHLRIRTPPLGAAHPIPGRHQEEGRGVVVALHQDRTPPGRVEQLHRNR